MKEYIEPDYDDYMKGVYVIASEDFDFLVQTEVSAKVVEMIRERDKTIIKKWNTQDGMSDFGFELDEEVSQNAIKMIVDSAWNVWAIELAKILSETPIEEVKK